VPVLSCGQAGNGAHIRVPCTHLRSWSLSIHGIRLLSVVRLNEDDICIVHSSSIYIYSIHIYVVRTAMEILRLSSNAHLRYHKADVTRFRKPRILVPATNPDGAAPDQVALRHTCVLNSVCMCHTMVPMCPCTTSWCPCDRVTWSLIASSRALPMHRSLHPLQA
jgi:hypothetical protein